MPFRKAAIDHFIKSELKAYPSEITAVKLNTLLAKHSPSFQ